MKILLNKSFFLTILLVFNSTYSSVLSFSYYTIIFSLIFIVFIFIKNKLLIDSLFLKFSILFFLVSIFLFFSLPSFDLYLTGYNYLKFLYAYLSIKIIGFSFFHNIVKIGFYGSIISFPFFLLQLINFDFAFKLVGYFQNIFDFLAWRSDQIANNIIFTVNSDAVFRNSGFMWEPKGFSNFLIIALIFRLFQNNLKLYDKYVIVIILAIITTFSTAGFIALFFVFLFYFLNKNLRIIFTIFPFFLLFSVYIFFTNDLLYKKILYELSLNEEYKTLLYEKTDYNDKNYSLGRVGSFIVDFEDFLKRPFFGYGFSRENRTQSAYVKLIRVNGLSDLFVVYGFLGFILFFYMHHIFLKLLNNKRFRFINLLSLAFIVLYFATTMTGHPFWTSLLFLSVIIPNKYNFNT